VTGLTEVAFHFNVSDTTAYLPRLLRKARARGSRLVVWCASPGQSKALSQALWIAPVTGFAPHAIAGDPDWVRSASPVLLTSDLVAAEGFTADVLVNLGAGWPTGFERFDRVIEVVSTEPAERAAARERWRAYKQQGVVPQQHDLSGVSADA